MRRYIVIGAISIATLSGCKQQAETKQRSHSSDRKSLETKETKKAAVKETDSNRDDEETDEDNKESEESSEQPCKTENIEKKSISFEGSKGDNVPGYLWIPCKKEKKYPAVLAMYGISGDKDSDSMQDAATKLAEKGYVTLTIDWPGTGDRQPSIEKSDRVLNTEILEWTVNDYRSAVDYLVKQKFVDGNRIGYIGASMGAMTGLAFAGDDRRIKAMVAIVPIPNPLWGNKAPEQQIKKMSNRSLLCLYTKEDFSNSVCEQATGTKVKIKEYQGGHELEDLRDDAVKDSVSFLKKNL